MPLNSVIRNVHASVVAADQVTEPLSHGAPGDPEEQIPFQIAEALPVGSLAEQTNTEYSTDGPHQLVTVSAIAGPNHEVSGMLRIPDGGRCGSDNQ